MLLGVGILSLGIHTVTITLAIAIYQRMKLLHIIKQILIGFFEGLKTAVWIEVTTDAPRCTYYFGPFDSSGEAQAYCPGYIQDLTSEGAVGIKFQIKRCNPNILTVCEEPN